MVLHDIQEIINYNNTVTGEWRIWFITVMLVYCNCNKTTKTIHSSSRLFEWFWSVFICSSYGCTKRRLTVYTEVMVSPLNMRPPTLGRGTEWFWVFLRTWSLVVTCLVSPRLCRLTLESHIYQVVSTPLSFTTADPPASSVIQACPEHCECFNGDETVDCSRKGVTQVPHVRNATKRLYLEDNQVQTYCSSGVVF